MKLVACLVALLAAGPISSLAQNYIANPDFENGSKGWRFEVAKESVGTSHKIEVVEGNAREGRRCLSMTATTYARLRAIASAVSVVPGERWKVSAWVWIDPSARFQPDTPGLFLRVTPVERLNSHVATYIPFQGEPVIGADAARKVSFEEAPVGQWIQISGNIIVPDEVSAVRLELMSFYASGTLLWDSVSMEKLP